MNRVTLAVYAGKGSSHSWTWLADLFERNGIINVRFLDTDAFTEQLTNVLKAVIISGGDGFAVASAIGASGFSRLNEYIDRGGKYVGICAGAYLPLHSSIPPFNMFNLSTTKIQNIEKDPNLIEDGSPRKSVRYGNCAVIHPVRGEIELEADSVAFTAPLYGGPIFMEPTSDEVLARYRGFTHGTELQFGRTRSEEILLRKPAALRSRHGQGDLILLGPHLEHPRYQMANVHFMRFIGVEGTPSYPPTKQPLKAPPEFLARALADLKVAVLGLENRSFLVGNKMWDGSRFLELVNAMESRIHTVGEPLAGEIALNLMIVRAEIMNADPQSLFNGNEGTERLVETTRRVIDNHFKVLRETLDR